MEALKIKIESMSYETVSLEGKKWAWLCTEKDCRAKFCCEGCKGNCDQMTLNWFKKK
jgi:hypothetical protein